MAACSHGGTDEGKAAEKEAGNEQLSTNLVVASTSPFNAVMTFKNDSTEAIYLLKAYVPANGILPASLFSITRDGQKVGYIGPLAKLPGKPRPEDYEILNTGAQLVVSIPLQPNYDLTRRGTYVAQYIIGHPQPKGGYLRVASNKVTFQVK